MATLQVRKGKKNTTYRVEFMREGKRISKSFKLKKDAQKFIALLLVDNDLANSLTNHILTTLNFSDAVKQFLDQDEGKDPHVIHDTHLFCLWLLDLSEVSLHL